MMEMLNNHHHARGNVNANLLSSKRKQETPVEVIKEKQAIIANGAFASRETMNNNNPLLIVSAGWKWSLLVTVATIFVTEISLWFTSVSTRLPTTFLSTVKLPSEKNAVLPKPLANCHRAPQVKLSQKFSQPLKAFWNLVAAGLFPTQTNMFDVKPQLPNTHNSNTDC